MVQVAQYESDLSDEVVEENNDLNQNKKVKKKKRSKHWVKEATFDNAEEAEESVENIWSKQYTNYTDHGRRVYYRCNKAKLRGPQCSASIHLLYHADSDQVTVYKTEGEHDHHDEKVRGIDENVKKCIEELYNDGIMKSKQIIRALQTRKMKMPTLIQIKNYLVQYKKKKYGLHK
ncbi:unnamed protein product, partial [Rotaria sordida]